MSSSPTFNGDTDSHPLHFDGGGRVIGCNFFAEINGGEPIPLSDCTGELSAHSRQTTAKKRGGMGKERRKAEEKIHWADNDRREARQGGQRVKGAGHSGNRYRDPDWLEAELNPMCA